VSTVPAVAQRDTFDNALGGIRLAGACRGHRSHAWHRLAYYAFGGGATRDRTSTEKSMS